jgi:hypothetical protein
MGRAGWEAVVKEAAAAADEATESPASTRFFSFFLGQFVLVMVAAFISVHSRDRK